MAESRPESTFRDRMTDERSASPAPLFHRRPAVDPTPERWTAAQRFNAIVNTALLVVPFYGVSLAAFGYSLYAFVDITLRGIPHAAGWPLLTVAAVGTLLTIRSVRLPEWLRSASAISFMLLPQAIVFGWKFAQAPDSSIYLGLLFASAVATTVLIGAARGYCRERGLVIRQGVGTSA